MIRIHASILCLSILTLIATAPAFAQSQTQPQSTAKPTATVAQKAEDVSKWTQKQWNAWKAKWSKENRWTDCQKQADKKSAYGSQKLVVFFDDCMTK